MTLFQLKDVPGLTDAERELIAVVIEGAKANVAENDELLAVAFLFNSQTKESTVVGSQFDGADTKDGFAFAVKKIAKAFGANLSVLISESWTLDSDDAMEYQKNQHKYPNGLRDHPKRKEIVSFFVENLHGHWIGKAEILRGEKKRRMSDVLLMPANSLAGRFTGFLPKNASH